MNIIREFPLKEDMDLTRVSSEPIQIKDIPLLVCRNKFDTHIEPTVSTLKDIVNRVENPMILENKDDNYLWCFGDCLDPEKGHQKENIVNNNNSFIYSNIVCGSCCCIFGNRYI